MTLAITGSETTTQTIEGKKLPPFANLLVGTGFFEDVVVGNILSYLSIQSVFSFMKGITKNHEISPKVVECYRTIMKEEKTDKTGRPYANARFQSYQSTSLFGDSLYRALKTNDLDDVRLGLITLENACCSSLSRPEPRDRFRFLTTLLLLASQKENQEIVIQILPILFKNPSCIYRERSNNDDILDILYKLPLDTLELVLTKLATTNFPSFSENEQNILAELLALPLNRAIINNDQTITKLILSMSHIIPKATVYSCRRSISNGNLPHYMQTFFETACALSHEDIIRLFLNIPNNIFTPSEIGDVLINSFQNNACENPRGTDTHEVPYNFILRKGNNILQLILNHIKTGRITVPKNIFLLSDIAQQGDPEILNIYISIADTETSNIEINAEELTPALYAAIKNNHVTVVQELLKYAKTKEIVLDPQEFGRTLCSAAASKNKDILQATLDYAISNQIPIPAFAFKTAQKMGIALPFLQKVDAPKKGLEGFLKRAVRSVRDFVHPDCRLGPTDDGDEEMREIPIVPKPEQEPQPK